MKREVWVECEPGDKDKTIVFRNDSKCMLIDVKKITLHESRWIPVSERMPDKPGHYHVIRLDREDWCACLHESLTCAPAKPDLYFTSKDVTHWLEAPPLPVEQDGFEAWWHERGEALYNSKPTKHICRLAWNAAKELK